jgi:hypothetical protein
VTGFAGLNNKNKIQEGKKKGNEEEKDERSK